MTGQDRTARALYIGTFAFVVERRDNGGVRIAMLWRDATNGIDVSIRRSWPQVEVYLPRLPL
jgi:hypothetical protein